MSDNSTWECQHSWFNVFNRHCRFFFKTLCEDLDNTVIQEEITNDSDILPLYEGKVMALVKPSE